MAVSREVAEGRLAEVRIADAGPLHRQMVAIRRSDVGPPGGIVRSFLKLLRDVSTPFQVPADRVI
jgi:hypothetical protein